MTTNARFGLIVIAVVCLGFVAWTLLWPNPTPQGVHISFPSDFEVSGQDVNALQQAISSVIYRHQPAGKKWWISNWDDRGGVFQMTVSERAAEPVK